MFRFDFMYLLTNMSLLLVTWYSGYKISKGHSYWKYAIAVIIAFTVVEGLRYGRGVDYMHYIDVYNFDLEKTQVLFTALNTLLKEFGIRAECCFFFYAFFFIVGAMFLLKSMRKFAAYVFPCFLVSVISHHEAFIRQFLAMSFVFVYIYILNRIIRHPKQITKFVMLVLMACAAYSIHSISAVTIFVVTIFFFFFPKPISWRITIPALFIGKFILATSFDLGYFGSLLNIAGSADVKFAVYTDNSDRWFSNDAMNVNYTRNFIIQVLETFGCASAFYLGHKICGGINGQLVVGAKKNIALENGRIYTALFNTFVLGTLVLETFYNLELVRRVAYGWYIYWFVPVALVLFYRKEFFAKKIDRFLIIGFSFWLWEYLRFLFVFVRKPLFLWDI